MSKKLKEAIEVYVIAGVEGPALVVNDTRVAGPKPWGCGCVTQTWRVAQKDMARALGSKNVSCPDCGEFLVKTWIECDDGSGWFCGWVCKCEKDAQAGKGEVR